MAFKKGQPKIAGRKKGTPNKKSQSLIEKANELGIDPFEVSLLFAKGDWKALGYGSEFEVKAYSKDGDEILGRVISPELRASSARDASRYLYPVMRAIEVSGPNGGPIQSGLDPESKILLDELVNVIETMSNERRKA